MNSKLVEYVRDLVPAVENVDECRSAALAHEMQAAEPDPWVRVVDAPDLVVTEIRGLLQQSIIETRIVHETYSDALYALLLEECSGHTTQSEMVEFWGTVDGDDWRVHLDR